MHSYKVHCFITPCDNKIKIFHYIHIMDKIIKSQFTKKQKYIIFGITVSVFTVATILGLAIGLGLKNSKDSPTTATTTSTSTTTTTTVKEFLPLNFTGIF